MCSFVDLGTTTPPMEDCAQVGARDYDYYERAKREAKAFINQLRRMFGPEPPGARLAIKSHPHDFGTYITTVVFYDNTDELGAQYAQRCDAEGPQEWDEAARSELQLI